MKLKKARGIAGKYRNLLKPYCSRIEIAGSIRREKPEPNDIEIVAIPKDIFAFTMEVNKLEKVKGEPTGKYTQRILPEGIKLDLFMATEKNWGNIFLIRTGNAQFSRQIMIRALRLGLKQRYGYLWRDQEMLECKEEEDMFKILKLDFIPPQERDETYFF